MSNQQDIFSIIQGFAGQGNILTIPRPFIDYMGSIEGGLFLSQLLYWSDRTKNPHGWMYKTYKEWWDELRLSEYQVRKAAQTCIKRKILKTKIKKANGNPTVHYKLDIKTFSDSFLKFFSIETEKTSGTSNREYSNLDEQMMADEMERLNLPFTHNLAKMQ